jgi:hypothetical protein
MGKITEREPHPDDPIFREGLRMYSVRLGPRRGHDGADGGDPAAGRAEVAEIFGPARPLVRSDNLPGGPRFRGGP